MNKLNSFSNIKQFQLLSYAGTLLFLWYYPIIPCINELQKGELPLYPRKIHLIICLSAARSSITTHNYPNGETEETIFFNFFPFFYSPRHIKKECNVYPFFLLCSPSPLSRTMGCITQLVNNVQTPCEHVLSESFLLSSCSGHFLGNGSVIEILRSQGHNVTHIKAGDPLPRWGRPSSLSNYRGYRTYSYNRGRLFKSRLRLILLVKMYFCTSMFTSKL
jgi:hypothetical protein